MKNTKSHQIIFALILVLFAFTSLEAQQIKVFSEAKGTPAIGKYYDFEKWSFSIGEGKYEIGKKGRGKRINSRNRVTNFRISIEEKGILNRIIYFAEYKNDLLLISELDFGESGASFIVCLDGKTLKTKWRRDILSFNIAQGLIEDNSVYLTAIGFAAKINLDTGKFIWKHEDFYRKYKEDGAFNIFETPKIEGNIITLTENQNDYNRPPNVIKFNKISGKVIEVKVN